jgi:hypothetical protein
MADIYKLAECVVVWLDPASEDSSLALKALDTISSKIQVNWAAFTITPASENEGERVDQALIFPYDKTVWQEIHLSNDKSCDIVGLCQYPLGALS